MKVQLINNDGTKDITELITSITWSGDYQQAARKLEVGIAVSPHDAYLPKIFIGLGHMLKLLTDDGKELFRGYVFYKEKSHQGDEMKVTAYDGLIYLTKSQMSRNFKNMTAEAITQVVCSVLGVTAGSLATTGIIQNYIAQAQTGYDIIMTVYTAAAKQNGKKYMPLMQEGKLNIIEKGVAVANYTLDSEQNLTDATYSESIENMVNRVVIVDDKGNGIGKAENMDWIKNYGLIQQIYQKEDGKNPQTVAGNTLQGIERKASIEAIGNTECIAGRAVKINEAYTGLTGLFFIDADTHTWQNGQHTMSLTVDFQNMMDSKEAGS